MNPQTVLKINPIKMTAAQVEYVRDQWISEYEKHMELTPELNDLCLALIERVKRASSLVIDRYVSDGKKSEFTSSVANCDPEYFDQDTDRYFEENDSLDGDFPLGNEKDAEFASPYFSIEQLVYIQLGKFDSVPEYYYLEPMYTSRFRIAFIAELKSDWSTAEYYYSLVGYGSGIDERQSKCRENKISEGERCYSEALKRMESGDSHQVKDLLLRAVSMKHSNATIDAALCYAIGAMGFPNDKSKALSMLRKEAKDHKNCRACMELIKIHEADPLDVSGKEARYVCEIAANEGSEAALKRLNEDFDLRSAKEILTEREKNGSIDALWLLYKNALDRFCAKEAQEWYDKALEAGQADAMYTEAQKCLWENSCFYNKELGLEYLRRAAAQGHSNAEKQLKELN